MHCAQSCIVGDILRPGLIVHMLKNPIISSIVLEMRVRARKLHSAVRYRALRTRVICNYLSSNTCRKSRTLERGNAKSKLRMVLDGWHKFCFCVIGLFFFQAWSEMSPTVPLRLILCLGDHSQNCKGSVVKSPGQPQRNPE